MTTKKSAAKKPAVYEPRRVYVVLNAETKRVVDAGTDIKSLREIHGSSYLYRTFVREDTVRAGGRS